MKVLPDRQLDRRYFDFRQSCIKAWTSAALNALIRLAEFVKLSICVAEKDGPRQSCIFRSY
jgi:hypothetical protein